MYLCTRSNTHTTYLRPTYYNLYLRLHSVFFHMHTITIHKMCVCTRILSPMARRLELPNVVGTIPQIFSPSFEFRPTLAVFCQCPNALLYMGITVYTRTYNVYYKCSVYYSIPEATCGQVALFVLCFSPARNHNIRMCITVANDTFFTIYARIYIYKVRKLLYHLHAFVLIRFIYYKEI